MDHHKFRKCKWRCRSFALDTGKKKHCAICAYSKGHEIHNSFDLWAQRTHRSILGRLKRACYTLGAKREATGLPPHSNMSARISANVAARCSSEK